MLSKHRVWHTRLKLRPKQWMRQQRRYLLMYRLNCITSLTWLFGDAQGVCYTVQSWGRSVPAVWHRALWVIRLSEDSCRHNKSNMLYYQTDRISNTLKVYISLVSRVPNIHYFSPKCCHPGSATHLYLSDPFLCSTFLICSLFPVLVSTRSLWIPPVIGWNLISPITVQSINTPLFPLCFWFTHNLCFFH